MDYIVIVLSKTRAKRGPTRPRRLLFTISGYTVNFVFSFIFTGLFPHDLLKDRRTVESVEH